eukprot:79972_1
MGNWGTKQQLTSAEKAEKRRIDLQQRFGDRVDNCHIFGNPQDDPDIVEFKKEESVKKGSNTSITTYYKLTNNKLFDKPIAVYCTNLISESIRMKLLSNTKLLENTMLDYRYPFKDKMISGQIMQGRGPWICHFCLHENPRIYSFGTDHSCSNCNKVWHPVYRMQNKKKMEFVTNDYTKNENYINDKARFEKYGARIQNLIDPLMSVKEKYFIPSVVDIDKNYNVSFVSEINNLSKFRYAKLYDLFAVIFKSMIKMFEFILQMKLNQTKLNVIVSMQQYQIKPKQTYKGSLHCEGFKEENIACVGVYYFDKSDYFEIDQFQIAMNLMDAVLKTYPLAVKEKYFQIEQGSCMVFSNRNLLHKLDQLTNDDDVKVATRTILNFFVIDPSEMIDAIKPEKKRMQVEMGAEIEKVKLLTTEDIMVNMSDKYELIVLNWYREYFGNVLSTDLVLLLVAFTDLSLIQKRRKRDEIRILRMVPQTNSGMILPWYMQIN